MPSPTFLTGSRRKKSAASPLAPDSTVNGSALARLAAYGQAYPEIAAAAPNPTQVLYYYPRLPNLLTLRSGTIIAVCSMGASRGLNAPTSDNTSAFIAAATSLDNGKTFGPLKALITSSDPGIATPHKSNENLSLVQGAPGDDTIYGIYYETIAGNNTASPWYDYAGNNPAQSVAQKVLFVTFTESAGVLTLTSSTDVSHFLHVVDTANQVNVTAAASNGDGSHGGLGSYRFTCSALNAAFGAGNYMLVRFEQFTAVNHNQLNYSFNGNVPFYCKIVDSTHFDLVDAAAPGYDLGTTFTFGPTALPELTWMSTMACNAAFRLASNRLYWLLYGRCTPDARGTPVSFGFYTDNQGSAWSTSTQSPGAIGEIEPFGFELSTPNNLYFNARGGNGAYRVHRTSTDGGASWNAQVVDDGTGGTTKLNLCPCGDCGGIPLGGGKYAFVGPHNPSFQRRPTVYLSSDLTASGGTWPTRLTLAAGVGRCNSMCKTADGNILVAYEANDILAGATGRFATAGGEIALARFNLAALQKGNTTPDSIRFGFNDLPSGLQARIEQCSIRDYGGMQAHAVPKGAPTYAADGLIFHGGSGDYAILTELNGSAYDPDDAYTDSGDFTVQLEITCPNAAGSGILFNGDSRVGTHAGAGTGGLKVDMSGGDVRLTVDDGTHACTVTAAGGGGGVTNNGTKYRIVLQRDTTGINGNVKVLNWWMFGMDGASLGGGHVPDTTTTAQGALSNVIVKCLLRSSDTTANHFTDDIKFSLFDFTRTALTPSQFQAIPYVPPAAETWTATGSANSPDALGHQSGGTADKLQFWIAGHDGYGAAGVDGNTHMPTPILEGMPALGWIDRSPNRYFPAPLTDLVANYLPDATYGGSWVNSTTGGILTYDARTAGAFDFIHRFTSAWTITFRFRAHTDAQDAWMLNYDDGTHGWKVFKTGKRWRFQVFGADAFYVQCGITNSGSFIQYSLDQYYQFALRFSGFGGSGTNGITQNFIPLSGGTIQTSDVTGTNLAPQLLGGDTLGTGNLSCTGSLIYSNATNHMGDLANANIQIRSEALSDADLAKACNYIAN